MNFDYDRGRIYIYFGGNPMDTIYDVAMVGEERGQSIGEFEVDFLKNFQTFDYAITGTPLWGPTNPQGYNPGKVYVLFGGNPMDSVPDVLLFGRTEASWLGMCMSTAGDLNGDYCDELIAGAPTEYDQKGAAYLWLGGSLLDTIPDAWLRGEQSGDGIGWGVASAGDVDDDGRDEIMVCNSASSYSPKRVWVCKYTGSGIEENRLPPTAFRIPLEIKPNPAKSFFTIRWTSTRFGQTADRQMLKIFDVSGELIKEIATPASQPRNDSEIKISLQGINPGIYFLQLGTTIRKFLVIR